MKRVLLTTARAPSCLGLAGAFSLAGFEVFVGDCIRFPMARVSNRVCGYLGYRPPAIDPKGFIEDLKAFVIKQKIDLLVPTCEDIFFIAPHKAEFACEVYCDDFAKLESFHNKYRFTQIVGGLGIEVPKTYLLTDAKELGWFGEVSDQWVFKPVYSRFATHTHIAPSKRALRRIKPSPKRPWVVQQRIVGREFCSYTIAYHGQVRAMSLYEPKYRIHQSSGVFFEPIRHPAVEAFIQNFVTHFEYHGQVGFDLIEIANGRVYAIECNPRTTSGVHLLEQSPQLASAFSEGSAIVEPEDAMPACMKPIMWTYILPRAFVSGKFSEFWTDMKRSREAAVHEGDSKPLHYRHLGLLEAFWRWLRRRGHFREACTYDIEWDG